MIIYDLIGLIVWFFYISISLFGNPNPNAYVIFFACIIWYALLEYCRTPVLNASNRVFTVSCFTVLLVLTAFGWYLYLLIS